MFTPAPITVDSDKYYLIKVCDDGSECFDIDTTFAQPNHKKTQVLIMSVDPFAETPARETFSHFLEPFIEVLPEGKKDLDYFVLYHDGTEWKAYDVEQYVAPRTWLGLREVTGLKDL